jgi:hypothetical protein
VIVCGQASLSDVGFKFVVSLGVKNPLYRQPLLESQVFFQPFESTFEQRHRRSPRRSCSGQHLFSVCSRFHSLHDDRGFQAVRCEAALDRFYNVCGFGPVSVYSEEFQFVFGAVFAFELLEGVCDDKRAKGRNLRDKIDSLQRLLPNKNIIRNLHHFRFTGNQAVHQLEAPNPNDARLAIEVMEDLLNFLYELDYKASRLRKSSRARRSKKSIKSPFVSAPPH